MHPRDSQELVFTAFGVCGRVLVDAAPIEKVRAVLPPGAESRPGTAPEISFGLRATGSDRFALYEGSARLADGLPLDIALGTLERQIRTALALNAPDVIFVHAGCVAREGRALVLPGPSFAGKTSLVAALVRAGAQYYSDEYAVLDHEGSVLPYARPLAMRSGLTHEPRTVESLGGAAGREPAAVAAVIVTEYQAGAVWDPRRLSEGEAAMALMRNTVPAQTRPAESLRAVTRAVAGARIWEGPRPDAALVAETFLAELA